MGREVATERSKRNYWTTDNIRQTLEKARVVVFARGNKDQPRCGFTEEAFTTIDQCGEPYTVVDVCEERSIIPALRAYSHNKARVPSIFIDGELCASSDNLHRMVESGELMAQVKAAFTK